MRCIVKFHKMGTQKGLSIIVTALITKLNFEGATFLLNLYSDYIFWLRKNEEEVLPKVDHKDNVFWHP